MASRPSRPSSRPSRPTQKLSLADVAANLSSSSDDDYSSSDDAATSPTKSAAPPAATRPGGGRPRGRPTLKSKKPSLVEVAASIEHEQDEEPSRPIPPSRSTHTDTNATGRNGRRTRTSTQRSSRTDTGRNKNSGRRLGCDALLRIAAKKGSIAEARRLLRSDGADPDATDAHGWSAMHWAATDTKSEGDLIRLLINEGGDVELADVLSGWTPLHVAAVKSNLEVAMALVDAGAKKNAKSMLNEIPLSCVKRMRSNTKLYDVLTTHPRQLDRWPEKWLDSELRRRNRGSSNSNSSSSSRKHDSYSQDENFRDTNGTRDTRSTHPEEESEEDYEDEYED